MKRLVAKRQLKRICENCSKIFKKGDVYYRQRDIYVFEDGMRAFETLICPKCKYKREQHNRRFEEFKKHCEHPQKFIATEWSYMPGECVKEPDYDYCTLCGQTIY